MSDGNVRVLPPAPASKTEVELSPLAEVFLEACFVAYESARVNATKEWSANGKPPHYKPPLPLSREQIKAQCLERGLRDMLNLLTGPVDIHGVQHLAHGHHHGPPLGSV